MLASYLKGTNILLSGLDAHKEHGPVHKTHQNFNNNNQIKNFKKDGKFDFTTSLDTIARRPSAIPCSTKVLAA